MKISLDGNIVLTSAPEMLKICKPLKDHLNLGFRYSRIFKDGSRFVLCGRPEIIKFTYEDGYYPITWFDNGNRAAIYQPGYFSWATNQLFNTKLQKNLAKEIKKHFSITAGIVLVTKNPEFVEVYEYGSSDISIYQLNPKIFTQFNHYFKDQAKKIILKADHERIIIPKTKVDRTEEFISAEQKEFLDAIPIDKYYLNGAYEGIYLTSREVECLSWVAMGKTTKEIARMLCKSEKTIHRHLENIKVKMRCKKQAQLISIAAKQGLIFEE